MLALARFGANPLTFLDGLRGDERDIVPFTLGNLHCHLLKRPADIQAVLESEDWPPLSRGRMMALDKWYGGGLILTEGPEHHRQRDELWKPVLADPTAAAGRAVSRAARRADSWKEGEPIEVFTELRSLCWSIEWETLTGEDLDASPRAPAGAGGGHRGDAVAARALRCGALGLGGAREHPHARGP